MRVPQGQVLLLHSQSHLNLLSRTLGECLKHGTVVPESQNEAHYLKSGTEKQEIDISGAIFLWMSPV